MNDLAAWRDASLALLVLECFVLGLPIAALGYYTVRYLRAFQRWLADHFPVWQAAMVRGRDYVDKYSKYVAVPVVGIRAFTSSVAAATRLRKQSSDPGRRSYYEQA